MMELSAEQRDLIILASAIRGGVMCRLTTARACGYIIRPELNVPQTDAIKRALESIGVEQRKCYSNASEITQILNGIQGLEDLSPTPYGIEVVRKVNGLVFQPTTHDEVLVAIEAIEGILGVNA